MRQLPKAIPELDGGLFVPRPVVDLLDALLTERERDLRQVLDDTAANDLTVVSELRHLLRLGGSRLPVPPASELLGLTDPQADTLSRNLLRE
ncbi:MAG: hypothetical protein QE494_17620 [Ramlibacter sp.]|jgi:hypothetical protein|uniref:hypothetical protein n=1 Tax=Ramlibacter sp. TaxID=1917967 RepID=UPI002609E463|nr:hypothetical protein [Ramlibacter sp.]MDH4378116.1 hypothetical protein [Ramlibacter sp.]